MLSALPSERNQQSKCWTERRIVRGDTFTHSALSVDAWSWSLLWQRVPHIPLFHFPCRFFFHSFLYCVQFLWDDSQIKCVHIEILLKKRPPRLLSGSSRTTMWKCVWEHFCLIPGKGQCNANSNLIHARIDYVLLRVKCWNMHIKTTNWFYFLQCASGDGYRSTLKKIGFFTTIQAWLEPGVNGDELDNQIKWGIREKKKMMRFEILLIIFGCISLLYWFILLDARGMNPKS